MGKDEKLGRKAATFCDRLSFKVKRCFGVQQGRSPTPGRNLFTLYRPSSTLNCNAGYCILSNGYVDYVRKITS